ncbi:hypothetical protein JMJ58_19570 [Haloterrigena salifodinae]|uniref:Uncharacterized protein n=1 Tax=Haloterrigena salifodinae TaxID=2675099 RepID=A0A8T8E111_9EURY|nr:hypothetical protein [Haloterrigena salifodinae]QRV15081.1 hypothetical protein JMJ58_19570 [Haloterrigena salifodinae]
MADEEGAFDAATEQEIESVPGLKTALEIIGHANRTAHENGNCVIEFEKTESGRMNIQDITQHVAVLEGISELLTEDEEDPDADTE